MHSSDLSHYLTLFDWRRITADTYAAIRSAADPSQVWHRFVETRDKLFKEHEQSPLSAKQRSAFQNLRYYPYNPSFRSRGRVRYDPEERVHTTDPGADGEIRLRRIGIVDFEIEGQESSLGLYWLESYAGGLFLPFRDKTNQSETYGGGRYLFDSAKGADLGSGGSELILDFNFSYNPSCAYNPKWICPLPPPDNRIDMHVRAGERRYHPPEMET